MSLIRGTTFITDAGHLMLSMCVADTSNPEHVKAVADALLTDARVSLGDRRMSDLSIVVNPHEQQAQEAP